MVPDVRTLRDLGSHAASGVSTLLICCHDSSALTCAPVLPRLGSARRVWYFVPVSRQKLSTFCRISYIMVLTCKGFVAHGTPPSPSRWSSDTETNETVRCSSHSVTGFPGMVMNQSSAVGSDLVSSSPYGERLITHSGHLSLFRIRGFYCSSMSNPSDCLLDDEVLLPYFCCACSLSVLESCRVFEDRQSLWEIVP